MHHIVEKPWGRELIWAHTDEYAAKKIYITRGHRLSLQYHNKKVETVYVLSGTLHLVFGDETIVMKPGESKHIPAGTHHRMMAGPDEDVELMEVSTPQLDDVVRLDDDYGRSS